MKQKTSAVNQITEGIIWKQLLLFFFPIMLGTLFQQLYNTADAIIVGRFVGKEALACVGGSSGQLINLVVGFFVGLSSGATVIIARYYGAKNKKELNLALHTASALAIIGSIIITVFGILLAPAMLRFMNTPSNVMTGSVIYLRIYFAGIFFVFVYNIGSAILRAMGDSKRPLYYLIVCCFINVFLDIFLVVGFNLGITGAALATLFSQAVSAVLVIRALMKPEEMYQLEPKKNPPAPIFAFLYSYNRTSGRLSIYDVQYCQYHYSVLFKSSGNRCNGSLYCIRKNGRLLLDDFRCIFGFDCNVCRTKLWCRKIFKDETKRNCLSFDGPCCLSACKPDFDFLWKLSLPALYAGCWRYQSRNGNYFLACTKLCFIYLY